MPRPNFVNGPFAWAVPPAKNMPTKRTANIFFEFPIIVLPPEFVSCLFEFMIHIPHNTSLYNIDSRQKFFTTFFRLYFALFNFQFRHISAAIPKATHNWYWYPQLVPLLNVPSM